MESVLITGSAQRIGAMIAENLAASGYFVWIHYLSHEAESFKLRQIIQEAGGYAETIQADLTDTNQIDSMLQRIHEEEQTFLTTLINNASIFIKGTLSETTPDDWDKLMNTNLKAVWYLSDRFSESFSSAKRIITIGDASVSNGFSDHAVYGLSKYALKYLTEQMALSYAPRIRVNLLSPGMVLKSCTESDENWARRTSRTLADNSGIIDEILKAIRFLMSDPGLDGSELIIDNGLHLHNKVKN